ncbi:hypothetical protein GCM10010329_29350 [Streptomyces spiroverticillatus]|uniref:Uncharacterized protein n=1 Tax=Streptomyces finlayi TaxID=67296 RepID=A0A918WVS0_9ACTN|nr:hypothetical protein GCM10010329_29350 [Streptomyces spiroverticillatus]GHC89077.1 hypothetical protein GCM10010334_21760 [Streptomyces finlayi]
MVAWVPVLLAESECEERVPWRRAGAPAQSGCPAHPSANRKPVRAQRGRGARPGPSGPARPVRSEADRQPEQEGPLPGESDPLDRVPPDGQGEGVATEHQLVEGDLRLETGECGTDAAVRPVSVRDVSGAPGRLATRSSGAWPCETLSMWAWS